MLTGRDIHFKQTYHEIYKILLRLEKGELFMKAKKRFLRLSLAIAAAFVLSIGLAAVGMAESGAPAKIGFVDMTKILKNSKAAKSAQASLQKEIDSKKAVMKEKSDKLAAMDKELRNLKQDSQAWKDKRDKLTKDADEFNRLRVEYDGQLQKKNVDLMQKIFTDVQQVIKKVAADEKYTIVLDKRAALLVDDSIDLTDKVMKMYDAQKK